MMLPLPIRRFATIAIVLLAAALFLLPNIASAADYEYSFNQSQLPFSTVQNVSVAGLGNETLDVTYDDFLSGASTVALQDGSGALSVSILVPNGTSNGSYTKSIGLNNSNTTLTKTFQFTIVAPPETPPPAPTPFLNLSTDRAAYNLGEAGTAIASALANTSVNITICPNQTGWVQCYPTMSIPSTSSYPATKQFVHNNKTGNYIVQATGLVGNTSLSATAAYTVVNSISIQVAGDTRIDINEQTTLTAAAAGGISPYTYTWRLANGTTFSSNQAKLNYPGVGDYVQNITAVDAAGNSQTARVEMQVRQRYPGVIIVHDNPTGARIEGAEVTIDEEDMEDFTDGNGEASFSLYKGTYRVMVKKSGYGQYYKYHSINDTFSISISLKSSGTNSGTGSAAASGSYPSIRMQVADRIVVNSGSIVLSFNITDDNPDSCTVLMADNADNWYRTISTFAGVVSGNSYEAGVSNLADGTYSWKVECADKSKNKASSEQRTFIMDSTAELVELDGYGSESAYGSETLLTGSDAEFAAAVQQSIEKLAALAYEEKTVAEALGLEKVLQNSIKQLEWARRDINALDFRRDLSATQKSDERARLEGKIESIKKSTPSSISVTETKKYVKYVREEELQAIIADYSALPPERKIPGPAIDHKRLLEGNRLLQQHLTVSTTVHGMQFTSMDGTVKEYTAIIKDVRLGEGANITDKKTVLIEHIPKGVGGSAEAGNASNFIYGSQYTILEEDPIIEFSLEEGRIAYAIPGSIDSEVTQSINTVLYDPAPPKLSPALTASVIGFFQTGPLAYLIVLASILVLVYIIYIFNLPERLHRIYSKIFKDKSVSYINVLVNDALDYLDEKEGESAELIYREIKLAYEKIPARSKEKVYDVSIELCNKLDEGYLASAIEELASAINTQNQEKAEQAAEKVYNVYSRLLPQHQRNKYQGVLEALHKVDPGFVLPYPEQAQQASQQPGQSQQAFPSSGQEAREAIM